MKIYKVGGAIRDSLLGKAPNDSDWVVVGSSPEEMMDKGFKPIGKDFPVFLHPKTNEEYALARTEKKTGYGYKGFNFFFGKEVTLEQDLSRRDLTINAIAQDEHGNIIDPFDGRGDLTRKVFKHVSNAFIEDPLRSLRLARFHSYEHLEQFTISEDTKKIVKKIADSGEIEKLSSDRFWSEIHKALLSKNSTAFFKQMISLDIYKFFMPNLSNPNCGIADAPDIKWAELQHNNNFPLSNVLPVPNNFTHAVNLLQLLKKITKDADIGDLNKIIQEINVSRNKDLINKLLVVECLTDSKNLIKEIMTDVCEIDFSNLKDIEPGKIQEKKDNMYNEILMRFYE